MTTYTITLINQFSSVTHSQAVQASTAQQAVEIVKQSVDDPEDWLVKEVVV
jgi:hypothetical protein